MATALLTEEYWTNHDHAGTPVCRKPPHPTKGLEPSPSPNASVNPMRKNVIAQTAESIMFFMKMVCVLVTADTPTSSLANLHTNERTSGRRR